MPIYTFSCLKCGKEENVERSIEARNLTWYCDCGGEMRRVFHPLNVIYRTAGFTTTDKRLDPQPEDFDDGDD